jgi:hypothetical protein
VSTGSYGTPEPPPPSGPQPGYWGPAPNTYGQPPGHEYGYQAPNPPLPKTVSVALVAVLVVIVMVAGTFGYLVGGSVFAASRLADARDALSTVMGHQIKMKGEVTALSVGFIGSDAASATPTDISTAKAQLKQVLDHASSVLSGIDNDDASLAAADAGLSEFQWLTLRSKSSLDAESARIEQERKVLAQGGALTSDYISLGNFYLALLTAVVDMQAIGAARTTSDVNSATIADQMLKADVDKAIQLDSAPGLPADVDPMLQNLKLLATDFGNYLFHASLGNTSAAQADGAAVQADVAKVEYYDFNKMDTSARAYYSPMVAAFNTLVTKVGNG